MCTEQNQVSIKYINLDSWHRSDFNIPIHFNIKTINGYPQSVKLAYPVYKYTCILS